MNLPTIMSLRYHWFNLKLKVLELLLARTIKKMTDLPFLCFDEYDSALELLASLKLEQEILTKEFQAYRKTLNDFSSL